MSLRTSPASTPSQRPDTLILAALLAVAGLWIALRIHWSWTPMEDAAMLLRYAQNLTAGHCVRWSLNQAPVDGATDFLYMVFVAALTRVTHLDVVSSARWIDIAAQTASVALLYAGARRLGGDRVLSTAATLYLIAGPFTALTNACFGTPLFAFFLLACWSAALLYADRPSWRNAVLMSGCGLLAGLTRPEGVLIAVLILAATLYACHPERSAKRAVEGPASRLVITFLLTFGILGGAYFAWRWHYFGYPLPNPFYIKGDGHLYPESALKACGNLAVLLLPALPLIPLGWITPPTRRLTNALLIVLVPFALMWVLLSNQNNHFFRFQYAIVPMVLMTVPALAHGPGTRGGAHPASEVWASTASFWRRPASIAAALAVLASMLYAGRIATYTETAWGMRDFAQRLQPLAARGYTMAVTEAGALPLYSQWNTIDALGLNDSYIAHHHQQIDADYLDRNHPELIMVHIDRSIPEAYLPTAFTSPPKHTGPTYNAEFLNFYAATHGYTLAALWGADQCNLHFYWLRTPSTADAFPDYATVLSDIRDHPYIFLDDAFLSHDYRNDLASIRPCAAPEGPPREPSPSS